MRRCEFRTSRLPRILPQAERAPMAAVAERHGFSEQAIYTWRNRCGIFQAYYVSPLCAAGG